MAAKDKVVKQLTGGIEILFKQNNITYYIGEGTFKDEKSIVVKPVDGVDGSVTKSITLEAQKIIIATGSEVSPFPKIVIDEERIVSSTGVLTLKKIPKRLAIIGAGIIGLEMGSVYTRLGSEVTVMEFQPAIGATMDEEVATATSKILKKQGIKFQLSTKVLGA